MKKISELDHQTLLEFAEMNINESVAAAYVFLYDKREASLEEAMREMAAKGHQKMTLALFTHAWNEAHPGTRNELELKLRRSLVQRAKAEGRSLGDFLHNLAAQSQDLPTHVRTQMMRAMTETWYEDE